MNTAINYLMLARAKDNAERRERYEGNLELATTDVESFEQKSIFVRGSHDLFDTETYRNYCAAKSILGGRK